MTLKGGGRLQPLKRNAEPIRLKNVMKKLLEKLLLPLVKKLRAGAKSWATTIAGIGLILVSVFGEDQINVEGIIGGIALIFARDADKSSQDSGIRPIVIDEPEDYR